MNRVEYRLSSWLLRLIGWLASLLPIRQNRVVLATARLPALEGNLAWLHAAMRRRYPDLEYVLLLEPYSYGLRGKLAYLRHVIRGMVQLRTARLFVVDNAYLPVHVAPHRRGTTVVQVWHAVGALKRFGVDTAQPLDEPERTFLHRHYDYVVCAGESSQAPYAAALRTPLERVLPLGAPRTDFFFDAAAMTAARERVVAAYPRLGEGRVVLYAPTFRGRGRAKRGAPTLDGQRLRAGLPAGWILALKTHPNLDPGATSRQGFDVVVDRGFEINELFTATDVLVTDYSSSIYEWALLRRPLVLLMDDLGAYERDPGLYLDYRTEMIGTQVAAPDATAAAEAVAAAVREDRFDLSGYDAFIARHLGGCDGQASDRFVDRFLAELGS
jgi:CDP-glycerol glycerophosphotransferase (TagB/SpsB family)